MGSLFGYHHRRTLQVLIFFHRIATEKGLPRRQSLFFLHLGSQYKCNFLAGKKKYALLDKLLVYENLCQIETKYGLGTKIVE